MPNFPQPLVDEASSVVRFFSGYVGLLDNRAYRAVEVLQLCSLRGLACIRLWLRVYEFTALVDLLVAHREAYRRAPRQA